MKIAVYTCNFGNYRNELNIFNSLNEEHYDKQIDYYIFTNYKELKIPNWTIIYTPLLTSDNTISPERLTSKFIKFVLPDILSDYSILIWLDNKRVTNKIVYTNIINLFESYPDTNIFNLRHPNPNIKTIQDEIVSTNRGLLENIRYSKIFLNEIKDFKSPFLVPETCIILRKNILEVNNVFKHCYEILCKYKLKRDQNIYNYAFSEKNMIPLVLPDIPSLLNNK